MSLYSQALVFTRLVATVVAIFTSIAASAAEDGSPKSSAAKNVAAAASSAGTLKKFLHSTAGTYGWEPVKAGGDGLSYDFFPDGRLHIQGTDGEATMWEGKWTLTGDKLTLTNSAKKSKRTVTAAADGKELVLDGIRYRRYRAQ